MDLSAIPLVDNHCHPFDPDRERGNLARQFSLALADPRTGSIENTILMKRVYRELGEFLDCDPAPAVVERTRRKAYAADRAGYVRQLFTDANIELALLDVGYPSLEFTGYSVDLDEFGSLIPIPYRTIHRLEPSIRRLIEAARSFEELLALYRAELDTVLGERGTVAIKTVIAYWTGLEVHIRDEAQASAAFARLRGRSRREDEKTVRDYLVVEGMRKAIEHDVPCQIHTGIGDAPVFDMRTANPILLHDVLTDDSLRGLKVVLVHSGYPWVEESGYLANQYDDVYIDLSEMFPLTAHAMKTKLLGLLEMAPITKIMYGSDGINVPEIYWFAARQGRRSIAGALDELVASGWLSEDEALDAARKILRDNAIGLYRLDPPKGTWRQEP